MGRDRGCRARFIGDFVRRVQVSRLRLQGSVGRSRRMTTLATLHELLCGRLDGAHGLLAIHRALEVVKELVDGATIAQVVEQRLHRNFRSGEAQCAARVARPSLKHRNGRALHEVMLPPVDLPRPALRPSTHARRRALLPIRRFAQAHDGCRRGECAGGAGCAHRAHRAVRRAVERHRHALFRGGSGAGAGRWLDRGAGRVAHRP